MPRAPVPGASAITSNTPPCDACRKSKLKCDRARPACETCAKRRKPCTYTPLGDELAGRMRRFHHRSKDGCQHCRTRRVRCDEARPYCGQCVRKKEQHMCVYAAAQPEPSPPTVSEARFQSGFRSNFPSPGPETPTTQPLTSQPPIDQPPLHQLPSFQTPSPSWHTPYTVPSPPITAPLALQVSSLPYPDFTQNYTPPHTDGPHGGDFHYDHFSPVPGPPLAFLPTEGYVQPHRMPGHFFASPLPQGWRQTGPGGRTGFGTPSTCSYADHVVNAAPMWLGDMGHAPSPAWVMPETPVERTPSASLKIIDDEGKDCEQTVQVKKPTPDPIWSRREPLSSTYIYQSLLVQQPDELVAFFPSVEQRHQVGFHLIRADPRFRHFFNETARVLIVVPTAQPRNPWLTHLSSMALGKPDGENLAHDCLRRGLLSVASFDIGFKMQSALHNPGDNAMYANSMAQREAAVNSLQTGLLLGIFGNDKTSADLALGTVVCLAIHDRLAGCQDWEDPLRVGVSIIEGYGGPAAYLGASPTPARRFIVEQMACVELLGCMTTWYAPKLLSWDADWILEGPKDGTDDHIETVYGWTRSNVQFSARNMILADEYRQCVLLERSLAMNPHAQAEKSLKARFDALRTKSLAFLEEGAKLRNEILMTPHSPRIILGNLINQACMVIWIRSAILGYAPYSDEVQHDNMLLLELLDEAMSRGIVQGLLLPITWAAAVAAPEHRPQVDRLFSFLQPQYHLERNYMHRLRTAKWAEWCGVGVAEWEPYMRSQGYYAPVF